MSEAAREAIIHEHLQTLKLPAVRRSYEALARQANDGGWAPTRTTCASCSKPKSCHAGIGLRRAACVRRTSPRSRPSIRSTGRPSRVCLGRRSWSLPACSSPGLPIWCATCERHAMTAAWASFTGACNARICWWSTSSASCRSTAWAASCCSTCCQSATRRARRA